MEPSRQAPVGRTQLVLALQALGVRRGDCVLVHSSLSSLGYMEGGADAVIDAFLEALDPGGTLAMPTLCQRDRERRFETWDIRRSPSDVGRITETFRLRPGSLRSDHPTHSVTARGPLASELTQGHRTARGRPGPWGDAAFAEDSPWQRLYDVRAAIVLLGVDFRVNTTVHYIEHRIVERVLDRAAPAARDRMRAGLQGWNRPGVWAGFDRHRLQEEIDRLGLLSRAACGAAMLLRTPVRELVDRAIEAMEADPAAWFRPDFCAWLSREGRIP